MPLLPPDPYTARPATPSQEQTRIAPPPPAPHGVARQRSQRPLSERPAAPSPACSLTWRSRLVHGRRAVQGCRCFGAQRTLLPPIEGCRVAPPGAFGRTGSGRRPPRPPRAQQRPRSPPWPRHSVGSRRQHGRPAATPGWPRHARAPHPGPGAPPDPRSAAWPLSLCRPASRTAAQLAPPIRRQEPAARRSRSSTRAQARAFP
mmetsp:Transcript_26601/g.85949  ORF Transcript_26601/g.85949 Transcript_26601/m.85949 type:complete len:203 (-) Transcript_26601:49-657(-)